jgi:hypothetical protein
MRFFHGVFQRAHDDLLSTETAASAVPSVSSFPLRATSKLATFITSHRGLFETAAAELGKGTGNAWRHLLDFLELSQRSAWDVVLSPELQQELNDLWYVAL